MGRNALLARVSEGRRAHCLLEEKVVKDGPHVVPVIPASIISVIQPINASSLIRTFSSICRIPMKAFLPLLSPSLSRSFPALRASKPSVSSVSSTIPGKPKWSSSARGAASDEANEARKRTRMQRSAVSDVDGGSAVGRVYVSFADRGGGGGRSVGLGTGCG